MVSLNLLIDKLLPHPILKIPLYQSGNIISIPKSVCLLTIYSCTGNTIKMI